MGNGVGVCLVFFFMDYSLDYSYMRELETLTDNEDALYRI